MVTGGLTAREVLDELHQHVARCEVLNQQTTQAFTSMSESHRAMALELKKTRENFTDRWDALNKTAWKALGAIALTILAGITGVAIQNWNIAHNAATAAVQVAAPAQAERAARDAREQQILDQLKALRKEREPEQ